MQSKSLSRFFQENYIHEAPRPPSVISDDWSQVRDGLDPSSDSEAQDGIVYDEGSPPVGLAPPPGPRSRSDAPSLSDYELPEAPSTDGFEALEASDPEEGDFEALEAHGPGESADNGPPRQSVVQSATAFAKRVQEVGGSTTRVATAGLNAVFEDLLDRNLLDPALWNPARWVVSFATGAATAGAVEFFSEYRGSKGIDHQATIDKARAHLQAGQGVFSRDQVSVVQSWLDEASRELTEFLARQHSTGNRHPAPPPPTQEAPEQTAPSEGGESAKPAPACAPTPAEPPRRKGTLGAHLESVQKAAERRNPNQAILSAEAPKLASVLQALQTFVAIPHSIQKTPQAKVLENSRANPALGNARFVANLEARAKSLAQDAHRPANEQNKRLLMAASGPGTGKTTSLQKMAQWAELPVCMLTGEAFSRMKIPDDSSAFTVFQQWVCERVLRDFRVDDRGVVNGILLLDDFHFAWEPDGPFCSDLNPVSRGQFFLFLKNMGDANQDSVFSVKLADGREFPLNLSRVQVIITLNKVPPELSDKAEPALRSRLVDLEPDYPTREDRRRIAVEHCLPEIKEAVRKLAIGGTLDCLDQDLTVETICGVADADAALIAEKFGGKHGFRGLFELLDRYKAHVLRKLEANDGEIGPALFSLRNGDTPFEPLKEMNAIKDYQCAVDSNMAEVEARARHEAERGRLRALGAALGQQQRHAILTRIHANSQLKSLAACDADLEDIERRLEAYARMPALLPAEEIGRNLTKKFGHFKARPAPASSAAPTGDGAPAVEPAITPAITHNLAQDGEVDRWGPLEDLMAALYWKRVYARGDKPGKANAPVRVTFTSADAFDDSVFQGIADVLGGLPVVRITAPQELIAVEDPYGVDPQHPVHADMHRLADRESVIVEASSGRRRYCRAITYGTRRYFYLTDGAESVLLHHRGMDAVIGAEKSAQPVGDYGSLGKSMRIRAGMQSELAQLLKPQLRLFDSLLAQAERTPELSVGEAVVVVFLHDEMRDRIEQWATAQANPAQQDAMTLFEGAVHEALQLSEVKLQGGRTFDARTTSVFLLNKPGAPLGVSEALANWKLGVPPIEGRSARAWDRLEDKLRDLRAELNAQQQALGKPAARQALQLNEAERQIFAALVAHDRELAVEARQEDYILPRTPLDESVDDFVKRLKAVMLNTFKTEQVFPDMRTFKNAWREYYADDFNHVSRRRRSRLLKEEEAKRWAREEEERWAQQKEDRRIARDKATNTGAATTLGAPGAEPSGGDAQAANAEAKPQQAEPSNGGARAANAAAKPQAANDPMKAAPEDGAGQTG